MRAAVTILFCLLAAPSALAQATPEATLARFVALANAGELTTPAGKSILTGEALEMATDAKSNLPAPDRVIEVSPQLAAARMVLRGARDEEADAYFYLEKTQRGWAISAFRAMAMTGMDMMLLAEMKKQKQLSPADQLIKKNLELILSTDSQLRAWFAANRTALDTLVAAWRAEPPNRTPATSRDSSGIGATLPNLGLTAIGNEGEGVRIVIGGALDNLVGFLRVGPSGPPAISPSDYIWIEELGDGWFLFRTT